MAAPGLQASAGGAADMPAAGAAHDAAQKTAAPKVGRIAQGLRGHASLCRVREDRSYICLRRTLGIATLEERMAVVEASQARLQSADGQKLCRQREPEVPCAQGAAAVNMSKRCRAKLHLT
jgi:hypothetical protein